MRHIGAISLSRGRHTAVMLTLSQLVSHQMAELSVGRVYTQLNNVEDLRSVSCAYCPKYRINITTAVVSSTHRLPVSQKS
jgi:hypothetical protein